MLFNQFSPVVPRVTPLRTPEQHAIQLPSQSNPSDVVAILIWYILEQEVVRLFIYFSQRLNIVSHVSYVLVQW